MKKSSIIGIVGFILIIIGVGATFVTLTGYKDVDSLLNIKEPSSVTVQGKVANINIDSTNDLIVFVLEGESGHKVLAYYSLSRFQSEYGGLPSHKTVESKVVINGVFIPWEKTGEIIGEIKIKNILSGCHKAYEAPQVKTK